MSGLFGRNTITSRADKIADFQINTATFGAPVPTILGTTRVSGNIIDYVDFTAHEHRHSQRVGKGGSKMTQIDYSYTVAVVIGLCTGAIQGIGKVWRDKEIIQYPSESLELTLFNGSKEQEPWGYMQSTHPERALPYSGLAYLAGVVDLGNMGSLPNYNFEIKNPIQNSGDGVDVNPADYILKVLMEGANFDEGSIDMESLDNLRKYCDATKLYISSPMDSSVKKVQSIIEDICKLINVYCVWSQNKLKFIPLADSDIGSWKANKDIKYDLTDDDFIADSDGATIHFERKDGAESYNQATVEFINRANGYEKETVNFEITADIAKRGLRPASTIQAPYIYTKERALFIAQQLALTNLYSRNAYRFSTAWTHCMLEPGDLVTVTDKVLGLDKKVVIIKEITESTDGTLTFLAIGKPPGIYSPARYKTVETEGNVINLNQEPGNAKKPFIFQPPAEVSKDGNEIFMVTSGGEYWGGATVWVSDDNEKYISVGKVDNGCTYGRLSALMSKNDNSCNVLLENGKYYNGTPQDAERGNTLSWLDGELIAHTGATMTNANMFTLNSIKRALYGTKNQSHLYNAVIVRLDDAPFRHKVRKEDIGKKIYIKLTSYNKYGNSEQALDEVTVHEYTIQPYYIPHISNLSLHTIYHGDTYDIVATFDKPTLDTFDRAEVWFRRGKDWEYGGNGQDRVTVSGFKTGERVTVKVLVRDTFGYLSDDLTAPTKDIVVEMKADIPNSPKGFAVTFGTLATFNWLEVRNADIDFYEIRTNKAVGSEEGLLGKSNNTTFSAQLTERQGTVYLYAHNPSKGYGAPSELTYHLPTPKAPKNIVLKGSISGISVAFDSIPPTCKGANIYIDDKQYHVTTNATLIPCESGIYKVRIAYVDLIGEGDKSRETLVTVKATIDKSMIDLEGLNLDKMDEEIERISQEVGTVKADMGGFSSKLTQLSDGIAQEVANANRGIQTQITQISEGIDLKLSKIDGKEIISRINLSTSGARIDGKLLHVTGQALFDDNIITNKMLSAQSVSADKLQVESLSAISATIGVLRTKDTGARTEIKDNLIEVYDDEGRLRVRMGVW